MLSDYLSAISPHVQRQLGHIVAELDVLQTSPKSLSRVVGRIESLIDAIRDDLAPDPVERLLLPWTDLEVINALMLDGERTVPSDVEARSLDGPADEMRAIVRELTVRHDH